EAEVQEMIQERRLKIQEIRESVKISRDAADREKAEGVQVFSALMESAERGLKELLKEIQDKQETTEREAEDFIRELEQEISELKKRSSEGDDPPNKNWVEDRVHPPSYEGTVERAVAQLEEKMKKMLDMRRVQQFAVDVTLDPDTAHPKLILSDDRKQVKHGDDWKKLPDNPERFSKCVFVLAEQSFSSGRFYFEVQVKGKTEWDLGVVRESVDRKEILALSTKNGFWTLVLRNENRYSTGEKTSTLFDLHPGPEKVGVFVDYDQGLVSFYDVDAAALIYSFTGCCFKEKLYPFFSPYLNNGGKNSAPLIICPVSQAG
uniref:B30.2/SPRY domain-containing protein n=1 Tax=Poecilia formosa TaxID=48698 RepID=A0A096LVP7_POEFO